MTDGEVGRITGNCKQVDARDLSFRRSILCLKELPIRTLRKKNKRTHLGFLGKYQDDCRVRINYGFIEAE